MFVFGGTYELVEDVVFLVVFPEDNFSNCALRSKFSFRSLSISALSWESELDEELEGADPTFLITKGT